MGENITKNKQSIDTIEKIVRKAFGEDCKLISSTELADGCCNVVYKIDTSTKGVVMLKIASASNEGLMSHETTLMETEVNAMRIAKEHHIFGVPEVYFYDTSNEICDGHYFIMEKLDGVGCHIAREKMTKEQQESIDVKIGAHMHNINQIEGSFFGNLCNEKLQFDDWYVSFSTILSQVLIDGKKYSLQKDVDDKDIMKLLWKHRKSFDEVKIPKLVHVDSWDGNIFVKDNEICGMIDWERALWADPLMEDKFRYHSTSKEFLHGYGKDELTKDERIRCYWYDLYLYCIMMFEVTYRHYSDDGQYHWARKMFNEVWEKLQKLA